MPNVVEISDFIGSAQLPQGKFSTKFNSIRDEFENSYIYKLLGADLGALFIADLDANGVPQTARFTDIYDAFQEDIDITTTWPYVYGSMVESKGIKFYIKMIVWFYAARNNALVVGLATNSTFKSENSELNTDGQSLARNYNKAIETGRAVQWYINDNLSTYPEYNGQYLDFVTGIY